MTKSELTVKEETSLAVSEAPAFIVETAAEDMVIPFLKIIQSQADEVTRGKEKYNENVKAGDIYDSTTRTIYKDAEIIVCGIRKYYSEWDGNVRGTLIAKHKLDSAAVKAAKRVPQVSPKGTPYYTLETAAGNALEETFGVVCVVKCNGIPLPATFTLAKSAFPIGKTLNTMLTMYQMSGVPVFKFSTNIKQNDKGSWFIPVFEFKEFEKDGDILAMASRLNRATDSILFSFSAGEVEEVAEAANEDIV
jgi:hypothetical protein